MEKLKRCSERRMNNSQTKLSNYSTWHRKRKAVWQSKESGVEPAGREGVLICDSQKGGRERGKFQSRVDHMVGGGARGRSARDNEGREWTTPTSQSLFEVSKL